MAPFETVRRCKNGSVLQISLSISAVRDVHGLIIGASAIARDITERLAAEERRQLLLLELDHRIRNLFSLAGSLVTLSARTAQDSTVLARAVRERLNALASATFEGDLGLRP